MTLDQIPGHTRLLLDANIIIYVRESASEQCRGLLRRCIDGDVTGILTSHILAEVMHRLMMIEAYRARLITSGNPARQLSEKPELVRSLPHYRETMNDLIDCGLPVEPVVLDDITSALQIQDRTGLPTNDSLLLAVAHRLGIHAIASSDKQLSLAPGIILYSPDDLAITP